MNLAIVPLSLTSVYAAGMKVSDLDFIEQSRVCERSLTVKGSCSPYRIWQRRLKKGLLTAPLYSRMLLLSPGETTLQSWLEAFSLSDSLASLFRAPVNGNRMLTKGGSLTLLQTEFPFCDPLFVSRKTSMDCSQPECKMGDMSCNISSDDLENLVTQWRADYLVRRNAVLLTVEKGFSSWPTIRAAEPGNTSPGYGKGLKPMVEGKYVGPLAPVKPNTSGNPPECANSGGVVQEMLFPFFEDMPVDVGKGGDTWLTPRATEIQEDSEAYFERMKRSGNPKNVGKVRPGNLTTQVSLEVKNWATPQAFDSVKLVRSEELLQKTRDEKTAGCMNLREQVHYPHASSSRNQEASTPLWRTPIASQAGARVETLYTKDGFPAKPGERAYRLNSDGTFTLQSVTINQQVEMGQEFGQEKIRCPTPSGCCNYNTKEASSISDDGLATSVKNVESEQPSVLLNPRWVESLMGLPIGWGLPSCSCLDARSYHTKTDNRESELRLLGNGVVPATAELAWTVLFGRVLARIEKEKVEISPRSEH